MQCIETLILPYEKSKNEKGILRKDFGLLKTQGNSKKEKGILRKGAGLLRTQGKSKNEKVILRKYYGLLKTLRDRKFLNNKKRTKYNREYNSIK